MAKIKMGIIYLVITVGMINMVLINYLVGLPITVVGILLMFKYWRPEDEN